MRTLKNSPVKTASAILYSKVAIPNDFLSVDSLGRRWGGDIRIGDLTGNGEVDFLVYKSLGGMKPSFIGGFSIFRTLTIIGTLGILLNAIYFLRAYQRIFLGPLNEVYKDLTDITGTELITIVPLAIIILWFGVYPAPLLNMIAPAMDGIIQIVQSAI